MKNSNPKTKNIKKLLAICFFLCLIIITIIQNNNIKKTEFTVTSNKLDKAFDNYTIAQISDLHNAEFSDDNSQIVDMLKKDTPDMIAITGDLIDSNQTDFDIALNLINDIKDIAPIYYITGNHEAWIKEKYTDFENQLIKKGVHVLKDEKTLIKKENSSINLIGLEDPDFYGNDEYISYNVYDRLINFIDQDQFNLLLSHRPELFESYLQSKVDLVLSGHAHGGQFRLPFIGGLIAPNQGLFPKYDAGIYSEKDTKMIVSKGIGNSIIPIRFNNQPEIVYVKLKTM